MQARALPTFVGLAVLVTLNVNLGLLLATGPRNAGSSSLAPGAPRRRRRPHRVEPGNFDLRGVRPRSLRRDRHPEADRRPLWGADYLLINAVGSWAAAWLIAPGGKRPSLPKSPLLSWPLLVFAVFIGMGVVRGHERWGLSYFSQPVRFVIYAGIAFAIADLTVRQAWQAWWPSSTPVQW